MTQTASNEKSQDKVAEAIISIRDVIKTNLVQGNESNSNFVGASVYQESNNGNSTTLLLTKDMEENVCSDQRGGAMTSKDDNLENNKNSLKLTNPLDEDVNEFSKLAEGILSSQAKEDTNTSLTELTEVAKKAMESKMQNVDHTFEVKNAGQYTLDRLMKEMLRPMLKEWLDANLPSLVKWIVTEQIEKILKQQSDSK